MNTLASLPFLTAAAQPYDGAQEKVCATSDSEQDIAAVSELLMDLLMKGKSLHRVSSNRCATGCILQLWREQNDWRRCCWSDRSGTPGWQMGKQIDRTKQAG